MIKPFQVLGCITMVILVIGGINWGLMGLFNMNLIAFLCRNAPSYVIRIIYIIVGLAAVYWIYRAVHCCKHRNCS